MKRNSEITSFRSVFVVIVLLLQNLERKRMTKVTVIVLLLSNLNFATQEQIPILNREVDDEAVVECHFQGEANQQCTISIASSQ